MDNIVFIGSETSIGNVINIVTVLCSGIMATSLTGLGAMGLGVIMIFPAILMGIGIFAKRAFILIAAGIAWMAVGVYGYTTSEAIWDLHYIMASAAMVIAFICFAAPFWMGEKPPEEKVTHVLEVEEEKSYGERLAEYEKSAGVRSRRKPPGE